MRRLAAAGLTVLALATVIVLGDRARQWNDELALPSPRLAHEPPRIDDPRTPLDLAAATCALGAIVTLAVAAIRSRGPA